MLQRPATKSEGDGSNSANEFAYWRFLRTQNISPYLFALIGGAFVAFSDRFCVLNFNGLVCVCPYFLFVFVSFDGISLRWLCRRTLAKYLTAEELDELFTLTKQGLGF